MNSFLSFLDKTSPEIRRSFGNAKPGSSQFDSVWKALAKSNPSDFEQVQHGFIKSSHYDPAANSIKKNIGLDVNNRSQALKDVLWSTSVQHGAGGANNVFKRALANWQNMSERQMINAIYDERAAENGMRYFKRSSPSIRKSVVNRFEKERKEALNMLG